MDDSSAVDGHGEQRSVIVNEAFVRTFWPGVSDPIGRRIRTPSRRRNHPVADRGAGDGARELSWPEFAAANLDLLERQPGVLANYYSDGPLFSERARRAFVMPDRVPLRRSLIARIEG